MNVSVTYYRSWLFNQKKCEKKLRMLVYVYRVYYLVNVFAIIQLLRKILSSKNVSDSNQTLPWRSELQWRQRRNFESLRSDPTPEVRSFPNASSVRFHSPEVVIASQELEFFCLSSSRWSDFCAADFSMTDITVTHITVTEITVTNFIAIMLLSSIYR